MGCSTGLPGRFWPLEFEGSSGFRGRPWLSWPSASSLPEIPLPRLKYRSPAGFLWCPICTVHCWGLSSALLHMPPVLYGTIWECNGSRLFLGRPWYTSDPSSTQFRSSTWLSAITWALYRQSPGCYSTWPILGFFWWLPRIPSELLGIFLLWIARSHFRRLSQPVQGLDIPFLPFLSST